MEADMENDHMAAGFEQAWQDCAPIEGWLAEEQARALYEAAARVPGGASIVEIGSHHGRSTVVLARGRSEGCREVVAVDPFSDPRWGGGDGSLPIFRANIERAGLEDAVRPVRGFSADVAESWDESPIGVLYVDGAHDQASVLADIDGWERHIVPGGRVLFHDAFSAPGVTAAVFKRHLLSRSFRYVGSVRTLCVFERRDLSIGGAAASALRLTARLWYFVRNVLVKIAMRRGWTLPVRLLRHRDPAFPY
jgi:predicted O-methyltransferase YrrM